MGVALLREYKEKRIAIIIGVDSEAKKTMVIPATLDTISPRVSSTIVAPSVFVLTQY